MLREQSKLIRKISMIIDVICVTTAFVLAYVVRSQYGGLSDIESYAWILLVALPAWLMLLHYFGFYSSMRVQSIARQFLALVKVHAAGGVIVASAIYLLEPHGLSRGFFGLFLLLAFIFVSTVHLCASTFLRMVRSRGYNTRSILLVGTQRTAERFIAVIELHKRWGLQIFGLIQPEQCERIESVRGYRVLGGLADLEKVCMNNHIDEVVFCSSREESAFDIVRHINILETLGITSRVVLSLYYKPDSGVELSMFHNEIPLLSFKPVELSAEQVFIKRSLDIAGSLVGLLLLVMLLPFLAVAIRRESPGPLFFGQTRMGQNGRTFTCWKLRSMYVDAEERKKDLLPLNEMSGAIFKIKDDPRITRVGRFLRKTSLDELPQFWNVLCGEMSLVGTRPPTPEEVAAYENWHHKRIAVKPGITGLWQVSGRNEIKEFDDVVRLDLIYIETWSLWLDIKILFKTILVVLDRRGSC